MKMRLTLIDVTNYKRVKKIVIAPGERSLLKIAGRNKQGKSSLLGAMSAALGGKEEAAEQPIRIGEEEADIKLEYENGDFTVHRRFLKSGSSRLEVKSKGNKLSSPQKILDKLVGTRFLDPLKFSRLGEKKQREVLLKCVDLGLDLEVHAKQRKAVYDNRTNTNRDVKRLKAELELCPMPLQIPDAESTEDLLASLNELIERDADRLTAVHKLSSMRANAKNMKAAIEAAIEAAKKEVVDQSAVEARQEEEAAFLVERHQKELEVLTARQQRERAANAENLEDLNAAAVKAEEDYDAFVKDGKTARTEAEKLSELDLSEDIKAAEVAIKEAADKNSERVLLTEQKKKHAIATAKLDEAEKEVAVLNVELEELDQEKATALAEANMPIEGLDVDEDRVLYGKVPLSQASGAEQLQVSLAIAAALSPELADIWVEDGALLDEESLELVNQFAKDNDLCIWLERVGESDDDCVIIEEGVVKT